MITRTQVKPYEVRYIAYENFKKKKPKKTSVIDHKAYQFYKKKAKYGSRENVAHYVEYGKIISEFYKIASEQLIEDPDGVYVDFLGYFGIACVQKFKYTMDWSTGNKRIKDMPFFKPLFVPTQSYMNPWCADNSFKPSVKKALIASLTEKRVPYTFNPNCF